MTRASPVIRRCEQCAATFTARRDKARRFCSSECYTAHVREHGQSCSASFLHQSDDKAKKIRANGLINKRIKLGWIVRPAKCELCNITARVDACHHDYELPHVITFACRSCHMRSHYEPALFERLKAKAKPYGPPPGQFWRLAIAPSSHLAAVATGGGE